jgi:hypothetical protein
MNTTIAKVIATFVAIVIYACLVPAGLLALTVIFVPTLLSIWWKTFDFRLMIVNVFLGWTGVAYAYALLWAWQGSAPTWKDCKSGIRFVCRFVSFTAGLRDIPPRKIR